MHVALSELGAKKAIFEKTFPLIYVKVDKNEMC